ncbi:MAG: branched-chain amino acid transaminase [Euryarchaeota archaeon]|nr:branched-chain amino acid transaminase [Euryarchaeota archaeon]
MAGRDVKLSLLTYGLHYGGGVFEGLRAYDTPWGRSVFRLADHMRRFQESARFLQLNLDYEHGELCEAVKAVVQANGAHADYIRPLAFFGHTSSLGLDLKGVPAHVAIITVHMGSYIGDRQASEGMDVIISSWEKPSNRATSLTAKICGNYVNSMLAKHEATMAGADEAIMLNNNGTVAEGTGENIFIVRQGRLITPDLASCVLEGVTRDTVLQLARSAGYQTEERPITRGELMVADEVFMTGTAAEIVPVRTINGVPVEDGRPGPLTIQLQRLYHDAARGEDERFIDWLCLVESDQLELIRV